MSGTQTEQQNSAEQPADVPVVVDAKAGEQAGPQSERPIVFFDGVCGLCNAFIDFTLRKDRNELFVFAPLQGETAARSLTTADIEELKSVVLIDSNGKTHRCSSAVVRILRSLGGVWALLGSLLWCVPRVLRDWGYRLVAGQRYRLFGKKEACRMPTPSERARFLS